MGTRIIFASNLGLCVRILLCHQPNYRVVRETVPHMCKSFVPFMAASKSRIYHMGASKSWRQASHEKDRALFRKITKDTEHVLYDLLPEMKHRTLRTQNHNYILPQIKTERFK